MSSPAEEFVKKWKELMGSWEYHLPLDELLELTKNCTSDAVREGLTANPGLLHQLLKFFEENNEEDPLEMVEIVRLMLDSCPEAAGTPLPSDDDPNTLVYPLHEACQNGNTPSKVIELLLEKSTAGIDRMVAFENGVVEWCDRTDVAGTPLHYYLYWGKGELPIVKRLVQACPEALTMKDMSTLGLTPLHTVLRPPSEPDLEVVKFLVQYNTSLLRERDTTGRYPIHFAFQNEFITAAVIEFLLENCPDVWEMRDENGFVPVNYLLLNAGRCRERAPAADILRLHVKMRPNAAFFRQAGLGGRMPIHHAAESGHGGEFCNLLVDLAPGCERIPDARGYLPLHGASHIDTVKYLTDIYPESIYATNQYGTNPFQYALRQVEGKQQVDILRHFLELDPTFASNTGPNSSLLPLQTACIKWRHHANDAWKFEVVKSLFDVYPSAILVSDTDGQLPVDLAKDALVKEKEERYPFCERHEKTITFLETQQKFVAEASSNDVLNSHDENGMLLLHRALLEKDISLGTVKMIVEGTDRESATRGPNPLHLACANCSLDIIQYLLGVYGGLVNSVDSEGCNILHIVCKGTNLKAVQYLLENYAPLVSETNNLHQLPFHILCDKSGKEELVKEGTMVHSRTTYATKENMEYVGTVWQFLLAHPAAVSSAIDRNHRETVC